MSNDSYDIKDLVKNQENFKAGKLREKFDNWTKITNDKKILRYISGTKIKIEQDKEIDCVLASNCNQINFSKQDCLDIDSEIKKLEKQNVISKSFHEKDEVISNIFFRKKKDGTSLRIILNIKKLNKQLNTEKFKMSNIMSALNLITPGCYLGSIDLVSAYYAVPIHSIHRKYFKFFWDNTLYQFNVMCNGLCQAPFIFNKLTKPIFGTLHDYGHLSTSYLDDSLLIGLNENECYNNIKDTVKLFINLGFNVHAEKSVLTPVQTIEYLGHIINSKNMSVELTNKRKERLLEACHEALTSKVIHIRVLARLIGLMVSSFVAIPYGKLFYRELDKIKSEALHLCYNWEQTVELNKECFKEINWWIDNVNTVTPIRQGNPNLIITSDASTTGYGAVCDNKTANGIWSDEEKLNHINVLELKGAFFALKMFASEEFNKHILLRLDNTTAVNVINNLGTCKAPHIQKLCKKLFTWAIHRKLWITATYIPSKSNEADAPSRLKVSESEWQLNPLIFSEICNKFDFQPEIDLMATRINTQLKKFVSFKNDPDAFFIDAFHIDWNHYAFYVFPPYNLVLQTLNKIINDKAEGLIVIPRWKSQPFYSLAMRIRIGSPLIFFHREGLLTLPGDPGRKPKIKTHLMILHVSGANLKNQD